MSLNADTLRLTRSDVNDGGWNRGHTIIVTALEDDDAIPEVVTLTHSASGGGYNGVEATVRFAVTEQDQAVVAINTPTLTIAENGGRGIYGVTLEAQPADDVQISVTSQTPSAALVRIMTSPASATQSLTFTSTNWNRERTVLVVGVNDDIDNAGGSRTVTIAHSITDGDVTSYLTTDEVGSVTVTITDDDIGLSLSPATLNVDEGGTATLTLTLAEALSADVEVWLTTTGGTASADDYTQGTMTSPDSTANTYRVTISAGDTTATFTIPTTQDIAVEDPNETIQVSIHEITAADNVVASPTARIATITIVDDDFTIDAFEPGESDSTNVIVVEESAGELEIRLRLSRAQTTETEIRVSTMDFSSEQGVDYMVDRTTVTFAIGETEATLTVTIVGDNILENNETFNLLLSHPNFMNNILLNIIIRDDDDSFLTIAGGTAVTEGDTATFTLTMTPPFPRRDVPLILSVTEITDGGQDFVASEGTISITIPVNSPTFVVSIPTQDDNTNEPDGAVTVAFDSFDRVPNIRNNIRRPVDSYCHHCG